MEMPHMISFTIHLKKGNSFKINCAKIEYTDESFILYDSSSHKTEEGYLSFKAVAAIIPDEQPHQGQMEAYRVQLKNNQHVDVYAHSFDLNTKPSVKFYLKRSDAGASLEVKNVYVATSEVIAIIPAKGLQMGRSQSLEDS
jgi:hypothetical protein